MSIATQSPGSRPSSLSPPSTGGVLTQPVWRIPRYLVARVRHLPTLALLRLILGTIWFCTLCFWGAAYLGIGVHRNGLQRIGRDAGAGVIQAQRIKTSLSSLDASVVRLLLIPADQQNRPEAGSAWHNAWQNYSTRREEFGVALIDAAAQLTPGQSERELILKLQNESSLYNSLVTRALLETTSPNQSSSDKAAKDVKNYSAAREKLRSDLIPAADALRSTKSSILEAAYTAQAGSQNFTLCLLVLSGLFLIALLVAAQYVLFQRTRRLVNPGLGVATLLSVAMFLWLGTSFGMAAGNLQIAKQDGFNEVKALQEAQALAQEARSEEGLWLLLPPNSSARSEANDAYDDKYQELLSTLEEQTYNSRRYSADYEDHINLTLSALDDYHAAHNQLIENETSGQHARALQSALGSHLSSNSGAPSNVFKASGEFDDALKYDLNTYQTIFDTALDSGFYQLENRELFASLLMILIATTAFLGIAPRLKEYAL